MVDGSDILALEGFSLSIEVDYPNIFLELVWYLFSCYHLFQVKVIFMLSHL
jgi:hypothetical protein